METDSLKIKLVSKKTYGLFMKIFCCKCFPCLRANDVSLLTSDNRKSTFQRMIKSLALDRNMEGLFDPLKLMIIIYLCEDKEIPHKVMQHCRLNPYLFTNSVNRTDLQLYIPQICNFLVFYEDVQNSHLLEDMLAACKLDYFFAHLYYFYMISLQGIVSPSQSYILPQLAKYNQQLLRIMNTHFKAHKLNVLDFFLPQRATLAKKSDIDPYVKQRIRNYGTGEEEECDIIPLVNSQDIILNNYRAIFCKPKKQPEKEQENQQKTDEETFSFESTIDFFQDLFVVSSLIGAAEQKNLALKSRLKEINLRLPASIYVPFVRKRTRLSNILNIVVDESRVFSTKMRAPFYLCIEIFCPAEVLAEFDKEALQLQLQKPITLSSKILSTTDLEKWEQQHQGLVKKNHEDKNKPSEKMEESEAQIRVKRAYTRSDMKTECKIQPRLPTLNKSFSIGGNPIGKFQKEKSLQQEKEEKEEIKEAVAMAADLEYSRKLGEVFGESEAVMRERIRKKSIFGQLKTWQLVHIMVKTGDNLKQEQFALQLIAEFNNIFRLENIPLILTPYEVLSLGPDCGIMEMVKDAVTIDGLLRKVREKHPHIHTIKEFFESYFVTDLSKAKNRFTRSLAAYSLVCYFLQIKDRHNGNILLKNNGEIVHIDFGFFLSNAPGKGVVELENSAPFKLNTQYLDVMDGASSSYFDKFRKYFYKGFQAARKHQDRILIMVKMMYSSSGMTMPCFEKRELAIKSLSLRFNPPGVVNDLQVSEYCQRLINTSLDNWATHWYDKWQYWAQGIFY